MDSDAGSYENLIRAQAKEILNSPDLTSMETLVTHLMSTQDDAQRSQAHQLFNFFKKHYPSCLSIKLVCLLRYSPHVDTRTNAAILLRKALTRLESHLWPNLFNSAQSHLRGHIFACFKEEDSKPIFDIIHHIIVEIGTETFIAGGQWPELADALRTVFLQRLASEDPDVRNVAFRAVASLISFLSDPLELLQTMVMVLKSFLKSNQKDYAQNCLKKFTRLAMKDVQILRSDLKNVVECVLQITDDHSLDLKTKYYAVTFMITLVELRDQLPGLMPMICSFLTKLFLIPMWMLAHLVDDPAWYDMETAEGENSGKEVGYESGIKCLNRILIAFGRDTVMMRAIFELLPFFLDAPEWQMRYAGVTTLAVVAEGCTKVLEYLERVLTKILNLFQDPHPQVRWETFHAIEQVSTHLGRPMPVFYCQTVLPALAAAIEEHQIPKVKAQAASAMLSFNKNCTPYFLAHSLDGIVRTLLVLLQGNDRTTKERSIALCIFNNVALQCREEAFKYYGTCLPFLLNACSDENPDVQQEAARGISICAVFGRLEFKPFVGGAISSLVALIEDPNILVSNDVKGHDIAISALWKICVFHCDCINAAQTMVMVLKAFLKSNQKDYAQNYLKNFTRLAMKDVQILRSDLKNVVECILQIMDDHSPDLKTKYYAVTFLITLVELRDQLPGLMPMIRPFLTKLFSIPMRMLAHIVDDPAWYDMESAEGENAGKEVGYRIGIKCLNRILIAFGRDTVMMCAIFESLPFFLDAPEWQRRHAGITTLAVMAEGCSKVLEYLERLLTKILNLFQDPHPRVRWETFHAIELVSTHLGPPMPVFYCQTILPALAAAIEEHQIPRVKAQAASAMLSFIKNCTPDFLALSLDGIVRTLLVLLQGNDRTAKERRIAFCIFNNVALQCREAAFKYYATCLPFLLNACSDENPDVQQEGARGISVCAEFGRSEFKPFVGGAISSLVALIEDPNILVSNDVKAHDIAVSALGKICEFHRDSIDPAQVLRLHLDYFDSSQQTRRSYSGTATIKRTEWVSLRPGILAGAVVLMGISVLVYLKRSKL